MIEPTITKTAIPTENKTTRLSMASATPVRNGRDHEPEGRERDPKNENDALKSLGSDERYHAAWCTVKRGPTA